MWGAAARTFTIRGGGARKDADCMRTSSVSSRLFFFLLWLLAACLSRSVLVTGTGGFTIHRSVDSAPSCWQDQHVCCRLLRLSFQSPSLTHYRALPLDSGGGFLVSHASAPSRAPSSSFSQAPADSLSASLNHAPATSPSMFALPAPPSPPPPPPSTFRCPPSACDTVCTREHFFFCGFPYMGAA